ncbi:MAG: RNA polymerase sigma factor, partial [Deltaproteobacteria bacterium]|nr:RNA polymerase sigma factor [Deltaproteobacteria bacterium]
FGPVIYARCRPLLRDEAAAEDAVQEVFMRVLKHLDEAPDDREAILWIHRIATNLCLNQLRDTKKHAQPVGDDLPDQPGERPSGPFANRDLARRLIEGAPEKLRAVAYLHFVDGLDQGEVARVLDLSRRTVVSRIGEFLERSRAFIAKDKP